MDHWVILGTNRCMWCDKVKKLLDSYRIKYTYFALDYDDTNPLKVFFKSCGLTTVPQVYRNGDRIGGHKEVKEWLLTNKGSLEQLGFFD